MTEGYEYKFEGLDDEPPKDPRPFHVRHRKALVYGLPTVMIVLLFVMCSGGVLEKGSPIYKDLAANYDVVLVSEKGEIQRLNLGSGKLRKVTAAEAGLTTMPSVPKEVAHKAGVVSAAPDLQWSVIARPFKEAGLRQVLVNSNARSENTFGKNLSWKKVFWSPDSKYLFFMERAEGGVFTMIGQVFSSGLMAEDDARPQVLVALETATLRTCTLAELPNNHYTIVVSKKEGEGVN